MRRLAWLVVCLGCVAKARPADCPERTDPTPRLWRLAVRAKDADFRLWSVPGPVGETLTDVIALDAALRKVGVGEWVLLDPNNTKQSVSLYAPSDALRVHLRGVAEARAFRWVEDFAEAHPLTGTLRVDGPVGLSNETPYVLVVRPERAYHECRVGHYDGPPVTLPPFSGTSIALRWTAALDCGRKASLHLHPSEPLFTQSLFLAVVD